MGDAVRGKRQTGNRRLRRQRGALGGVPDQVIAIAVGTLMVSGAITLGYRTIVGTGITQEATTIEATANTFRNFYRGMANYGTGNRTGNMSLAGLVPNGWSISGADWLNRYGLTVRIMGQTDDFRIDYNVNDLTVCMGVLMEIDTSRITQVTGPGGTRNNFPLSLADSRAVCGTGNGTVQITTN